MAESAFTVSPQVRSGLFFEDSVSPEVRFGFTTGPLVALGRNREIFSGDHLAKSWDGSAWVMSQLNSVSRHCGACRCLSLTLKPPLVVWTMKPRSCSTTSERQAVALPMWTAVAASRVLKWIRPLFDPL